jgi:adenylate kinase
MNVFVAGIHGVGKTYLASRIPVTSGFIHTSASKLIKEELSLPEWKSDKLVTDVDSNQLALAKAVARYNAGGKALLLDGHFVLLGTAGEFIPLKADVFRALNLHKVLLIEANPTIVEQRVKNRDGLGCDIDWLAVFMRNEREQAMAICSELNITLSVLVSPDVNKFVDAAIGSTEIHQR